MSPEEFLSACLDRLCLQRWDVSLEIVEAVDEVGSHGQIIIGDDSMSALIQVSEDLDADTTRETILHETVHLALYEFRDLCEKLVSQTPRKVQPMLSEMARGVEEQTTIQLTRAMMKMLEVCDDV